uniref:G-protein coupled receptor-like protein UL33 n=1 Tax=Human betaherpesvirus 6A TaxID=32603 RepID=A0A2L2Q9X0_9BETA|nr:G-protein coupled receptor-like protein UL33 [Human betaherpesvirus 6A]
MESAVTGITLTTSIPMIIIVVTTMILYHRVAKHNATSFYVITLFASDFVLMWCVFFMTVNRKQLFSFNRFFCQLVYFIYHAVCSYSISMLAIIATIRYKTLHRRKKTESKTSSTGRNIGILLLASSMCAIPTALFVKTNGMKKNGKMRRLYILKESLRTVSSGENCLQLHLGSPSNHGVQLLLRYILQSFARRHREEIQKDSIFY